MSGDQPSQAVNTLLCGSGVAGSRNVDLIPRCRSGGASQSSRFVWVWRVALRRDRQLHEKDEDLLHFFTLKGNASYGARGNVSMMFLVISRLFSITEHAALFAC